MKKCKQKTGIKEQMSFSAHDSDKFLSDKMSDCFYCVSTLFSSVVI